MAALAAKTHQDLLRFRESNRAFTRKLIRQHFPAHRIHRSYTFAASSCRATSSVACPHALLFSSKNLGEFTRVLSERNRERMV